MKVLSVDWDYFQKVSLDTMLRCYPDGLDAPTELSEITWGSHYASDGDEIREVSIPEEEFDSLRNLLLEQQNKEIPVVIANSHVGAYDFIFDNLPDGETVQLTNIDMHDDLDNGNPCLDCGNWIGRLAHDMKERFGMSSFRWIHNPVSMQTDRIGSMRDDKRIKSLLDRIDAGDSVKLLEGEQFDCIFIARSDTWSPPHLDEHFQSLVRLVSENFPNTEIEHGLDRSRYVYLEYENVLREQYEQFRKGRDLV